jgi:predicted metal-dependent phosphoesterase TrpH
VKIKWLVILAVILMGAAISFAADKAASDATMKSEKKAAATTATRLINPFEVEGQWYKTNLHTHTNLSDGDVNLPVRVKQYRDKGFQVLVITDHEKTNNVAGYSDKDFLLISGMEAHPKSGAEVAYHFVCINVPDGFTRDKEMTAQQVIDAIKAAGGEVIFAHPYWSGHTTREMLAVDGYIGLEVYNGSFHYTGKGYSSVQWDQLMNTGKILPAVATDDVHSSKVVGHSWIMIKAKELTVDAVMDALRSGSYYASCGPAIEDFRIENGIAKVKCSPAVEIYFMGQFNNAHGVTVDRDHLITTATYTLPKDIKWVRAEVVDANGRHAWTNPIEIKK